MRPAGPSPSTSLLLAHLIQFLDTVRLLLLPYGSMPSCPDEPDAAIPVANLSKENIVGVSSPFTSTRDSNMWLSLEAGEYVVIPMTYRPNELGDYWLSLYSQSPSVSGRSTPVALGSILIFTLTLFICSFV